MKIIFVGTAYPYRGGIAAFIERLAEEFQSEGDKVEIETFTLQYPAFLFPGKTQYSDKEKPTHLHITRSVNSCNPFNWWKVGRRLAKQDADIVVMKFWHSFMAPCLGSIARLIRKNRKTKVVGIIDNMLPHERNLIDKLFATYFAKSIDGFVAMSDSVLEDIRLFDQHKPKLFCPHPLYDNFGVAVTREEALLHLQLDPNKHYMLFFGFIRDYKGLDLLMKAYAHPWFKDNNVELIVAGEFYNNQEQYKILEKELAIENRIIWRSDFIPDDEVRYYFCVADIVVQPYKSATQSGVTQIAYHFEKPMLVTNVGGLPEIVPHGKVGYVTTADANEIATALIDFYEHKRTEQFHSHIIAEKTKYAWGNMTQAIKDCTNNLTHKQP